MSRPSSPLPDELGAPDPFSVSAASALGIGEHRLRSRDLHAPFAGVRAGHAPARTVLELVLDHLPRLKDGEFFSHVTAAVLHGMWLPLAMERDLRVHVAVHKPRRAPRGRRVRGHHLVTRPGLIDRWQGVPVAGAVETWCQLATILSEEDLVIAGDSLVAKGVEEPRRVLDAMIAAAADDGRPRSKVLWRAVQRVRVGSRSAGETRTRLVLVDGGLPEPAMNLELFDARGRFVAEGDLVDEKQRMWIEYEGDGHPTDQRQFRKDIGRYEELQDLGWRVVRVTGDDVARGRDRLVARVRRLLAPPAARVLPESDLEPGE